MKTHPRKVIAIVLMSFAGTTACFSQFYAPDTEYHDVAQRFFVVEAARILAARENEPSMKFSEVTYEVKIQPNRETSWHIRWLGPNSNTVREATVAYPESLLVQGPKFYRSVFRQLWDLKWRPASKSSTSNLIAEFWRGVNEGGFSRVESIEAIWKFQQSKPKEEQIAPHLAGLLQSAALPATGGAVSLDALLLARSAVWLCIAEAGVTASSDFDPCWAPTLFLVGRENASVSLWKTRTNETRAAASAGPISHGWNFLLQRPRAKEAFIYAASKDHRRFSVPIIVYYTGLADANSAAGTLMYAIFGSDQKTLSRLYDYSPFFSVETGVAGGRISEGLWPALARQAWLQAMEAQPLSRLEYSDHTNALLKASREVKATLRKIPDDEQDTSVLGLNEASPVLLQAYNAGVGSLIPTSVVTVRDLLQYGWESTCAQMETRYRFVNRTWGVRELARSIMTNAIPRVRGLSTFFGGNQGRPPEELMERYRRIQFIDISSHALRQPPVPVWNKDISQDASTYFRRCWLRTRQIPNQVAALVNSARLPEIVPFLTRLHAEGGPAANEAALDSLVNGINSETGVRIPGKQKLQEELAASLLEPSILQLNTAWDEKYEKMPFFKRGQELEKIYWDAPTTRIHSWIFHNYLMGHAETSARRFYGQIARMLEEPIEFSNGLGQMRYALALLDNDRAAMRQALADSECGSYANMQMLIWDAAFRDDTRAMERQIDEAIERYAGRPGGPMQRLKGFVPLLPALRDPKHADRAKALDYFANDSEWTFLQWILLQKHKLSTEDAVRFLGGPKTDLLRQTMVAYLNKDKARFGELGNKASATEAFIKSRFVLLLWLEKDLMEVKEPEDQKDLKPANAQTIEQAVLAFLEKEAR